ncbi:MAG TPA: carboxypeptidase-like regulatory domain-containing protein, partial [Polyangiaceae bacterium]|nr:carboxypeptidase-like regulatory domain-containing protein [Polyangiaceae bacterium]
MPNYKHSVRRLAASAVFALAGLTAAGCASRERVGFDVSDGSAAQPAGDDASVGTLLPGNGSGSGGGLLDLDAPAGADGVGSACGSVTCTPIGGQYCGTIGDGCGRKMTCPTCTGDSTCEKSICVGGPTCMPIACQSGGTQFCGNVGDNCGHALDCGSCPTGAACTSGVCVKSGCARLTCGNGGSTFCGTIGDGCGGSLPCGACPNGGTCGGGGIDHVCAPANCTKGTCVGAGGAQYCGMIGDGCGGALDCGMACPNGMACGGGGVPNLCPGTGSGGGCTGIACNVAMCPGGATTTLSGTVLDPAGVNPIYNALVYIPNAPLAPIPTGASCDVCGATASGSPIADALTDAAGHFSLTNVPTGTNIPLVIQVGKWRRQVTIPTVASCTDNPITDPNLTRLPRTQAEGNIPLIALTTGGSDSLECLLRRIGIADSEFTTDAGSGRVHLYYGGNLTGPTGGGAGTSSFTDGGATFASAATLWSSVPKMEGYDIMMLSCEGSQYASTKQPYLPNPEAYLNAGGRVFFDHLHFYWLLHGSAALQGTASYIGVGSKLPMPTTGTVNTTFPKGNALADWLVNVGATPARTQLGIYQGQHSVTAVNAPTQAWITVPVNPNDSKMRPSIQYMSFNTPVGAAEDAQCGRAVFTDLHMNVAVNGAGGDNSDPTKPFPTEC